MVPAGRASLIIANNPIFITLCAAIFFREPLSTRKVAGVLVSVCGAVLAISKGDPASLFEGGVGRGDGFMFCCVLSWVTYTLVGKAVLAKLSPLVTVTYSALIGTLGLGLPVMASGRLAQLGQYSLVNWLSMAYLGIFGTVIGFIWYYEGIQAIGAAKSSLFINVVPLSAIVMAYLFLGEPMTFSLVSGTLLVVAGVYLTTAPGKQAGLSATMAIRGGPS